MDRRRIRLCRPGTPDAYVILNNGDTIWIEFKIKNNQLTPHQKEFRDKISKLKNHAYIIIREFDDLVSFIKKENNNENSLS